MAEVHASDCTACDAARAVVKALREEYDPLDNWDEVEAEGKSQTAFTIGLVADVLHRFPAPPAPRPSRQQQRKRNQ